MNNFNKIILTVIFIFVFLLLCANTALSYFFTSEGKYYMTEINRACTDIAEKGKDADLSIYSYIINTSYLTYNASKSETDTFYESNDAYIIRFINGDNFLGYVKFTVKSVASVNYIVLRILVNVFITVIGVIIILILIYLKYKIIKPFNEISEMPYELAKGHLTKNLKEDKNRFFGKFIWGLDMLRETLEAHKINELSLAKENKMIVLSISHDIKTPLSAIKLYARALSENKNHAEISVKINDNVNKIEAFVNEIIKASKEDFLNINVKAGEFYLKELLEKIENYYTDKLSFMKTKFIIQPYTNCLIYGDIEKSLEAFENIIENALKYGDREHISISVEREEDCCLVTVSNSGSTLPENELVHIFDSFWRGSNVKEKKGSGLGLYICRRIFTEMKGDIFAEIKNGYMYVTAVLKIN